MQRMLPPLHEAIERCPQTTSAEWCKIPNLARNNIKTRQVDVAASAPKNFIRPASEKKTYTVKKGAWHEDEDELLIDLATQFRARDWSQIATSFQYKTVKQCRDRWHNQLNPSIDHSPWSRAEEKLLTRAQSQVGNRWASIAKLFPGRTANAVKNRFNSAERRRQNCKDL